MSRVKSKKQQPAVSAGTDVRRTETALAALMHPLSRLALIALALTAVLRWVFFLFAPRIWAMREEFSVADITPWARWAMEDRDGAEPQVLLALTLVLAAATGVAAVLLDRVSAKARTVIVLVLLAVAVAFAIVVLPRAPENQIGSVTNVIAAEAGILAAAWAAIWAGKRRPTWALLGLLAAPVCFLAVHAPTYDDLACVLAPALRMRLGDSLSHIYFQYDFLPSLVAVIWHWIGGDPYAYPICTEISYFLMLAGCFLVARRQFEDSRLASMLVVALCAVRIYGIVIDPNAKPQVAPLRLDLWLALLAPALWFGLRHWSVGLAAGALCFFSRSFGMIYVGSYGLALAVDFAAARMKSKDRAPFGRDLIAAVRQTIPALLLTAAGIGAAWLVFGGPVSEAVAMYQRLGLGMLRIAPESFYWWIAPALAVTGWLALWMYGVLPERRAQGALFAVALAIGSCIYFFGRSHEHNLINISASLLYCAFLGMDLAGIAVRENPPEARRVVRALPWALLALIGFAYSGRLTAKVERQLATLNGEPVPGYPMTPIVCDEINAVAPDHRVFVFSVHDYWFYERCGYVPQGYLQPMFIEPLMKTAVDEINGLLNQGYKVVVPKVRRSDFNFADFEPRLAGPTSQVETKNYSIFSRPLR